jgi:ABC-type dipeptide/oligopeptide/nickel transport system permease component
MLPLIIAILTANFIIIHIAPGSPISYLIGQGGGVSQEFIQKMTKFYGLDKPLLEQYFIYLANVLQGNLGYSYTYLPQLTVWDLIMSRLSATLILMVSAFAFSVAVGIPIGIISARKKGSLVDHASTILSLVGYSMPAFWLAEILVVVFSLYLGWLPSTGMVDYRINSTGFGYVLSVASHLILPTIVLGSWYLASITRLLKTSMLNALQQNFIILARAKGLSENAITLKYAFRNALLPLVTVISLNIGFIFGGACITETVFGWPGLGYLMYISIVRRDYPVILGIFTFISITVIIVCLIADLLYSMLDPRIRYDRPL